VIQTIIMGLVAGCLGTIAMDRFAQVLVQNKVVNLQGLQIVPPLLARWFFYIVRDFKFVFSDIRQVPAKNKEFRVGMICHYAIGAFLGVLYGFLFQRAFIVNGALYGFATNAFPWLMMYPAMGFGFFANRLPAQKDVLKFSFINHIVYGLVVGLVFEIGCLLLSARS